MLVKFTVGNYLSFKDKVTLDMLSTSIKDKGDENYFINNNLKILKSSILYGANASGKSNLFKAMSFIKMFIIKSQKMQEADVIKVDEFKLSNETINKPSYFEITFYIDEFRFRYGFEVNTTTVLTEWLFRSVKNREKESLLFVRENDKIELGNNFKEGKMLEEKTRNNALFLSVVASFNGEISKKILQWFYNFNIIWGDSDDTYRGFTFKILNNSSIKEKVINFLKTADISIKDLNIVDRPLNIENIPKSIRDQIIHNEDLKNRKINFIFTDVETKHNKYNKNGDVIGHETFLLSINESSGTNKLFSILGLIIDSIENGKILAIDEFESKLHPLITKSLVALFNSKEINKKNAQFILATHDTNLLTTELFRRDQIWFCEKDSCESTDLYSLADYKIDNVKVRNDASFDKDYIKGRYGAIPFIGDFKKALGI